MASADKVVDGAQAWALDCLKRLGYRPRAVMDEHIRRWWAWYAGQGEFYRPELRDAWGPGRGANRHLSLHPARMCCDEWAALCMDEQTRLVCEPEGFNAWCSEAMAGLVGRSVGDVSLAFALGTGAWVVGFDGITDVSTAGAEARVSFVDAGGVLPLETAGGESVSCAFATTVDVGGRRYRQLQVHEPDWETGGTYHVRTWLFDPGNEGAPVACDEVVPDLDTRSARPTYALVRPAGANHYRDNTAMGVSVFDGAEDAMACVDEAFEGLYWVLRMCQPRIIADDAGAVVDPDTLKVNPMATIDVRLFLSVPGAVGTPTPLTVYNPELHMAEREVSLNDSLSLFSSLVGLGPNYFSFTRSGGLKTATEVVADNATLMRNLRAHEALLGESLSRLVEGAYAAEVALRTGVEPEGISCEVVWDDSVAEDTESMRAAMKDDIARGLCPAWLYLAKYYGMSEEEARAFTGEAAGEPAPDVPEEA